MTIAQYNYYVNTYSDGLYRYVWSMIKCDVDAQDIVQESFIKFWEKRKQITQGKEKAYLFTMGHHAVIDCIRAKKRFNNNNIEASLANYSVENGFSEIQKILHEAISKLSEVQQSVILLRDYEGYSYKEIATITKLSEAQVKVYIYRARTFLKQFLVSIESVI